VNERAEGFRNCGNRLCCHIVCRLGGVGRRPLCLLRFVDCRRSNVPTCSSSLDASWHPSQHGAWRHRDEAVDCHNLSVSIGLPGDKCSYIQQSTILWRLSFLWGVSSNRRNRRSNDFQSERETYYASKIVPACGGLIRSQALSEYREFCRGTPAPGEITAVSEADGPATGGEQAVTWWPCSSTSRSRRRRMTCC